MSPEAIAKIEFLKRLTFCGRCGIRLGTKKAAAQRRCTNLIACSRRQQGKPPVKFAGFDYQHAYERAEKLGVAA